PIPSTTGSTGMILRLTLYSKWVAKRTNSVAFIERFYATRTPDSDGYKPHEFFRGPPPFELSVHVRAFGQAEPNGEGFPLFSSVGARQINSLNQSYVCDEYD